MSALAHQLVTTFHYVVSEQSGNDITVARAKTMLSLAGITWPQLAITVTPHFINQRRIIWLSEAFDTVAMGGGYRRDPVGDDASIIIDEELPPQLTMLDEMRDCAAFIPLFGRQSLERFNLTLAQIYQSKQEGAGLPQPGNDFDGKFSCEDEYRLLFDWLAAHGVIDADGQWLKPD